MAVSGGADSLLALRQTVTWARRSGRRVIALSVDHGLQAGSAGWSAFAADMARSLGADARILQWTGDKPETGRPAAARRARMTLLSDGARKAGARVIITGHTATDAAENAALGQGRLGEWSPVPVWPEGRGQFLFRPLLQMTRAEVRRQLEGLGQDWIDDPANSNTAAPRIRTRRQLGDDAAADSTQTDSRLAELALGSTFLDGTVGIRRACFNAAPETVRRRWLSAAMVCAGGGERLPRKSSLDRLLTALTRDEPVSATLAGARLGADEDIRIVRDTGEYRRSGAPAGQLTGAGGEIVWDGRYLLRDDLPGDLVPAGGQRARLEKACRQRLSAAAADARPGFPVILQRSEGETGPILAMHALPEVRWLVPERLAGACGLRTREDQLSAG